MPVEIESLRPHLQAFDFRSLLVEGLGWNHYQAAPVSIHVDTHDYALTPVAEKAEFVVYSCGPDTDGSVPPYPIRRKIERQIAKLAFEHMIIFVDAGQTTQIWQWVKREGGKPAAYREREFRAGQQGVALLQPLRELAVSLEEEEGLNISKVASRVRKAMDVEKVTKRFYERFKAVLKTFQGFIDGIPAQGDREWYASLMLNRMMFVYFVQKRGFLDGDPDYLRNRLRMVQREDGPERFQQFYRTFLLRLFHEGLGQPEAERPPKLAKLLGKIPFLNGGLFDVHDLELNNRDISIPDEAFGRVFDFFDSYGWSLDERPHRADNEINPDVLGYIFEKYVNQKQMGAYYTKEDITGYISRNTVIPFLFDAAKKECPVAFAPGGGVWRLLQDDPDRYIYPAVGHGLAWAYSSDADPKHRERPLDLPEDVAAGAHDVSKRGGWNRPASEEYALPTETWREVVARRQRYQDVRTKLAAGEVSGVNDLITLNLDIEQFAKDVIVQSEGPELLRAFWRAIRGVSVLDPTCGSGAFLFAALNILEPLYTACLEGMQGFLGDLERTERKHHPETMRDFREALAQAEKHAGVRYFILKSIVLNNLYGVDIMEEAVEICKLRLFLKLVAQLERYDQIEPLPDIDFNIRTGNTLVGFTSLDAVRQAMTVTLQGQYRAMDEEQQRALQRIEEEAETASRAFDRFREQQTELGGEVTAEHKKDLRDRLRRLDNQLDRHLATEYGIDPADPAAYEPWRVSHQPFHWFIEFYGIMNKGGFDVVIGNPPYVEYSKVRQIYTIRDYETESCGNLYAVSAERFLSLLRWASRYGIIVPISSVSTPRMLPLMRLAMSKSTIHVSNFAVRPSKLFDGVDMNLSIFLGTRDVKETHNRLFTTAYNRWNESYRENLFVSMSYVASDFDGASSAIPKVGTEIELDITRKLAKHQTLIRFQKGQSEEPIYWHSGGRYFRKCLRRKLSNEYKELLLDEGTSSPILCLLSSSLYYWLWIVVSDCYHVTRGDIEMVPVPEVLTKDARLHKLADALLEDLEEHAVIRLRKRADGTERKEVNYMVPW